MFKVNKLAAIIFLLSLVGICSIYFIIRGDRYNIKSIEFSSVGENNGQSVEQAKVIWQTAPNNPRAQVQDYLEDWRYTQGWTVEFRSDAQVIEYLTKTFPSLNIPSLMLEKPILGYDLFRYSIISEFGGFYVDSDVQKLRGFEQKMNGLKNCGILLGIEIDWRNSGNDWVGKFPRNFQFAQWTYYSRKAHPMLKFVTQRISRQIEYNQVRNISLADLDVMDVTGPGIWTDAILDYVLAAKGVDLKETVKCGEFYKIDDICILDVMGFANSIPHSDCKTKEEYGNDSIKISYHHFLGTWKD
ncbi:glycosyltransferase family 32 protein [Conidiobolus coronatus NRRL 28638]|uniref:Glycosyltransferase family 32 protein n=1 Tax=Conidiobolus coronatus (strain ATCC 28846 / CBS 209.66 / NRRL 28638) TaxID=796925 RepID=A0A137NYJ4_CONC2|nr:glycosyltransferase family 32 protein [Conidiobolus coronatus NRRL 28638]|eukprot:KXN67679.1 glycosyltransferase family 32 protein [Conidiobolus coronatus NRRL 28638]